MINMIILQVAVEHTDLSGLYKFLFWIVACLLIGLLGSYRSIGGIGAFLCSFFLTPVIGLIITLFSKTKSSIERDQKIPFLQSEQQGIDEKQNNSVDESNAENVKKLKDLLASNIISEDEYESMHKRIFRDSEKLNES